MLPFEIWRDAFINDADLESGEVLRFIAKLNLQIRTRYSARQVFATPEDGAGGTAGRQILVLQLSVDIGAAARRAMASAVVGTARACFCLVECDGSQRDVLQQPARLAQAIGEAGRD